MQFLPSLESYEKNENKAAAKSEMNWSALFICRCPRCNNYLERKGKFMCCTSKRDGFPDCNFRIKKDKMRALKIKLTEAQERQQRMSHWKALKNEV